MKAPLEAPTNTPLEAPIPTPASEPAEEPPSLEEELAQHLNAYMRHEQEAEAIKNSGLTEPEPGMQTVYYPLNAEQKQKVDYLLQIATLQEVIAKTLPATGENSQAHFDLIETSERNRSCCDVRLRLQKRGRAFYKHCLHHSRIAEPTRLAATTPNSARNIRKHATPRPNWIRTGCKCLHTGGPGKQF